MAKSKTKSSAPTSDQRLTKLETILGVLKWVGSISVPIVVAAVVLTFTVFLPERIESGISNSGSLNQRFAGVDKRLADITGSLEKVSNDVRQLFTPVSVAERLKSIASLNQKSLGTALPTVKTLLETTKELRLPMSGKQYQEISRAFSSDYESAKGSLKGDLWVSY